MPVMTIETLRTLIERGLDTPGDRRMLASIEAARLALRGDGVVLEQPNGPVPVTA